VANLSYRQGGVVFAPQDEDEWTELPPNQPLTRGDRIWTDRGARAELQLGAATLHVDGESHLGLSDLDERSAQFILQQGSVNLRVRELVQGENVEIDTPNLAFRALQPGDYRIDVDPRSGQTHVTVQSGQASLFGEGGESIQLGAGQQANFAGRGLAQVAGPEFRLDDFGLWVAERNRQEDRSVSAQYVPRGVVGYPQLDQYGNWAQDPGYGAVWYPSVTIADWAPYRYGHWSWVAPWGWTWVDDAPWGFAPFHYGRWTMIGRRWAWVPGRLAARPVYSPALVVFLGGGGTRLAVSSGPGVGWYPLAPGEAWWPVFRTSPRYVSYANFNINLGGQPRHFQNHFWRTRPFAVTAVAEEDFRRGRPVYRHWQPLAPQSLGNAQINVVPVRPELRHRGEPRAAPRLQAAPPAAMQAFAPRRFAGAGTPAGTPAGREQLRAQREADRSVREPSRPAAPGRLLEIPREQRGQVLREEQEASRLQAQREALQQRQRQQQEPAGPAPAQAQREARQRAQHEQLLQGREQEHQQSLQRREQEHQQSLQRRAQEHEQVLQRAQQEQAARAQALAQAQRVQQEQVQQRRLQERQEALQQRQERLQERQREAPQRQQQRDVQEFQRRFVPQSVQAPARQVPAPQQLVRPVQQQEAARARSAERHVVHEGAEGHGVAQPPRGRWER
jgi:hypothetical protein